MKNGKSFMSLVPRDLLHRAVWDPHTYRNRASNELLRFYAKVSKLSSARIQRGQSMFDAIEYADIPNSIALVFNLKSCKSLIPGNMKIAKEQQLLFGTMRAYLGNALVLPPAAWLDIEGPIFFSVKSEFVSVKPNDGFVYFWLAYLQSPDFLKELPVGTGGTRPRLTCEGLLDTMIKVPPEHIRQEVHEELRSIAELEWRQWTKKRSIFERVEFS